MTKLQKNGEKSEVIDTDSYSYRKLLALNKQLEEKIRRIEFLEDVNHKLQTMIHQTTKSKAKFLYDIDKSKYD